MRFVARTTHGRVLRQGIDHTLAIRALLLRVHSAITEIGSMLLALGC